MLVVRRDRWDQALPVGRGVEGDPSVAREVDFCPGVRVVVAYLIGSAFQVLVGVVDDEADSEARWDPECAQHYGHGRGVVVEVAALRIEEEVVDGVATRRSVRDTELDRVLSEEFL